MAKIKLLFKLLYENVQKNIQDILLVIGILMVAKGLYMIYQPSMWIVIGVLITWIAFPKKGG